MGMVMMMLVIPSQPMLEEGRHFNVDTALICKENTKS